MEATSSAYRETSLWQFFSFEGRVRRITFWVNLLVYVLIDVSLDLMLVDTYVNPFTLEISTHISYKPIYYAISLVVAVRWLSVIVRRWHDLDKSGWLAVISLVPVLGTFFPNVGAQMAFSLVLGLTMLVVLGFLGFVPGDEDANDYGPPPDEGLWF